MQCCEPADDSVVIEVFHSHHCQRLCLGRVNLVGWLWPLVVHVHLHDDERVFFDLGVDVFRVLDLTVLDDKIPKEVIGPDDEPVVRRFNRPRDVQQNLESFL